MSRKMTNEIREAIVKASLKHRFKEATEKLIADRRALGDRIYEAAYNAEIRELMDKLPTGFLYEAPEINFFPSKGSRRSSRLPLTKTRRFPLDAQYCYRETGFELSSKLELAYAKLMEREQKILEEQNQAENALRSTLAAYNTVKRLIEGWPEIEPLVPEWAKLSDDRKLPVPQVKQLNKLLGLPVKKDEASAAKAA